MLPIPSIRKLICRDRCRLGALAGSAVHVAPGAGGDYSSPPSKLPLISGKTGDLKYRREAGRGFW